MIFWDRQLDVLEQITCLSEDEHVTLAASSNMGPSALYFAGASELTSVPDKSGFIGK